MKSKLVVRASDSPLIHSVSLWTIGDEEPVLAAPDGLWDLVVYRKDGAPVLLVTGQTTRAVRLPFAPGDEILTVSFQAGAYLPFLPAGALVDRAEVLEKTGDRFRLCHDTLEIPRFDNAEDLVRAMERTDAIRTDQIVLSHRAGHPLAASPRSVQRHFLRTTGMSPRDFFLIERARRAEALLRRGIPASQAAVAAGYSDQPHLIRSLKTILGRTPGQIQTED